MNTYFNRLVMGYDMLDMIHKSKTLIQDQCTDNDLRIQ